MPTTRDDVVRAAVAVIEEHGLAGLTLRGVAARLGVSAPTLYWHVRDKRHLLDLVAERWLEDYLPEGGDAPTPGQPVWEWLAESSRRQRTALLSHRDSVQVVAGNRPTEESIPVVEQTIRVLVDAGLEPGEAVRVLTAVGSFILGDALETQAAAERPVPPTATGDWAERFPLVAAAGASMGGEEDRFEEGLALLMDGLRARLERRAGASRPARRHGRSCGPEDQE